MEIEVNVNKTIRSFKDLEVYKKSYGFMLTIFKEILPDIPVEEKYDLKDQLRRSCKAIPRLVAEGYGKRHQKAGFQKYLDDAIGESNEIIVSLEQAKDLYNIKPEIIKGLVIEYDIIGRQLYRLAERWTEMKTKQ